MASRNLKRVLTTTPIVIVLFFLLLMPLVSSTSLWESYQKFSNNAGFQDTTFVGVFTQDESHTTSSITDGLFFQPLVIDFDGDSVVEIIGHDSNFVKVYTVSGSVLSPENELNVGFIQTVQADTAGDKYIVGLADGKVYSITYNGTVFNASFHTNAFTIQTGISCNNLVGALDACYFGVSGGNIVKFNITSNITTSTSVSTTDLFNTGFQRVISPVISDIDNDGRDELIMICDNDTDTLEEVCVFDLGTLEFDSNFKGGLVEVGAAPFTDSFITGILSSNIEGSGTSEVCIGWNRHNGGALDEDSFLTCFKSDGSEYATVTIADDVSTNANTMAFNPIMVDVDGEGQREICIAGVAGITGGHTFRLSCYEASGGNLNLDFDSGIRDDTDLIIGLFGPNFVWFDNLAVPPSSIAHFVAADMNNDGFEDIISPQHIWFSSGLSVTPIGNFTPMNLTPFQTQTLFTLRATNAIADVNDDGFLEVINQYNDSITVSFASATNDPPVLNTRTFGQNLLSPICLDTTLTFTANECGAEPCHYTNDGSTDQERLVSTCGNNLTVTNGTLVLNNPTLSCFYSQAGSFAFNVHLQDNHNKDDFNVFQTKSIIVINGTAGVNCNLPVSSDILIGENVSEIPFEDQITSEAELKDTIEILTGQSQFMKNLLVVMFTIIFMFGMAKHTALTHPISYAISIFALWIGFALLGLLSWAIVFIYAITCVGLAIALYINSGGDSK